MLVLEIVSSKPLTPAQLMAARIKKEQQGLKQQRAVADVMRKREQLLKAQQRQAALSKSV